MLTSQSKVEVLTYLYALVLRDLYPANHKIVYGFPREGKALYNNAVMFFDLALTLKENIYDLMALGLSIYNEEATMRTYGEAVLPFRALVDQACRSRIACEAPKRWKGDQPPHSQYRNAVWQRVCLVLAQFDSEVQKELIESGAMVGNDEELKLRLLKQMESDHPLRFSIKEDVR